MLPSTPEPLDVAAEEPETEEKEEAAADVSPPCEVCETLAQLLARVL